MDGLGRGEGGELAVGIPGGGGTCVWGPGGNPRTCSALEGKAPSHLLCP